MLDRAALSDLTFDHRASLSKMTFMSLSLSTLLGVKIGETVGDPQSNVGGDKLKHFVSRLSDSSLFESALLEIYVDAKLQLAGWRTSPTEAKSQPDNFATTRKKGHNRSLLVECKYITKVTESAIRHQFKKANTQFRSSSIFCDQRCPTLLVIGVFPSEDELKKHSFAVEEAVLFMHQMLRRMMQPGMHRAVSNVCLIWDTIYASVPGIGARLPFTAHRHCLYTPNPYSEVLYPMQEEPVGATSVVMEEYDHSFPRLHNISIPESMLDQHVPKLLRFSRDEIIEILSKYKTASSSHLTIGENNEFVIGLKEPVQQQSFYTLIMYTLKEPGLSVLSAWRIPKKRIPTGIRRNALAMFEFVIDNCGKELTNGRVSGKIIRGISSVQASGTEFSLVSMKNERNRQGQIETPFATITSKSMGEETLVTIILAACLSHDKFEAWVR